MTVHETATLGTPFGRAVYYDLDSPLRMHVHSALHALLHLGGAPTHLRFADDSESVAHEDRAILVDPWVAHAYGSEGGGRSRLLALYVEPTMLRRTEGDLGEVRFAARNVTLGPRHRDAVDRLVPLVRARDESDGTPRAFADLVRALVEDFGAFEARGAFSGTGAMDRHVRAALEHLNDRRGRPFDGAALVAGSELGRSRLFERFAEVVGLSPKRYADTLRAEVAIGLLAADEGPIAHVADELGFSAPAHFTRFMREHTGLTPSEHRRRSSARGEAAVYADELSRANRSPGRRDERENRTRR